MAPKVQQEPVQTPVAFGRCPQDFVQCVSTEGHRLLYRRKALAAWPVACTRAGAAWWTFAAGGDRRADPHAWNVVGHSGLVLLLVVRGTKHPLRG